ncbi:MAG TPA: hypothetical protein VEO54_05305 [Thermoanaerobaculia bacterium]|nr:hypothetical protein [Thermoanaerobaculia bacterium]
MTAPIMKETRGRTNKEISMRKRLMLMLMVFAILLTMAPVAMADHCQTCNRFGNCRPATIPAYYFCEMVNGSCNLTGWGCGGPHPFTQEEPLAAEFTVASVERLDNRLPAPAEQEQTRVASLETPAPSQR